MGGDMPSKGGQYTLLENGVGHSRECVDILAKGDP